MPLLQIRDCPAEIYDQIATRAKAERRTIAQQTLVEIEKGLDKKTGTNEMARRLARRRLVFAAYIEAPMTNPSRADENLALLRDEREARMRRIMGEGQ